MSSTRSARSSSCRRPAYICRRPDRAVARQRRQERRGLLGTRDAVARPADRGELEPSGRVDGDLAARDSAAEDRPHGQQRVADRRRLVTGSEQLVDERLELPALDVGELRLPELWDHAEAQRLLVPADGARLVDVAGAVADRAVGGGGEPDLRYLRERHAARRTQRPATQLAERVRSPRLGLGERGERLADLLLVPRAPDLGAVGRPTVAVPTGAAPAAAAVPHLNAGVTGS